MTGKRLGELYEYIKSRRIDENGNQMPVKINVIKSTMTRATETANLIIDQLPKDVVNQMNISSCDLIREGAPIEPEPPLSSWNPEPHVSKNGTT